MRHIRGYATATPDGLSGLAGGTRFSWQGRTRHEALDGNAVGGKPGRHAHQERCGLVALTGHHRLAVRQPGLAESACQDTSFFRAIPATLAPGVFAPAGVSPPAQKPQHCACTRRAAGPSRRRSRLERLARGEYAAVARLSTRPPTVPLSSTTSHLFDNFGIVL